jgi:hypothetical protein
MLKQMSADRYSRLGPTVDGKRGTGPAVFETERDAEAGVKTILDGLPTEAPPVVGSPVYEIVADG